MNESVRRRLSRLESAAAADPNRRPYDERLAAVRNRYWDGTASVADYLHMYKEELEDVDAALMVTVPQLVTVRERQLDLVVPWSVLAYAPDEDPPAEVLNALPEWPPWTDDILRYKRRQDGNRLPPWRAKQRAGDALLFARVGSDRGLRLRREVWVTDADGTRLKEGIPEPIGQHGKNQANSMRTELGGLIQRELRNGPEAGTRR